MQVPWCTCSRSRTDGYTNVGNNIWVHQPCMKPSRLFWERIMLRDKIENELDFIIERFFDGTADEQDKGRAEMACQVLAWIENPINPNVKGIRDRAVKRYNDRKKVSS